MATPFVWGPGGQAITTPQQAQRQRAVAEALLAQAQSPAQNWAEGLADVTGALSGTLIGNRVSEAEAAGQAGVAEALAGLSPQSGFSDIASVLSNPWIGESPGGSAIASALLQQNMQANDPLRQLQIETATEELNRMRNPPPPSPDYGFTFAPDGTLIRTDTTSGTFDPMGSFPKPDTPLVQVNTGDTNDFFTGLSSAEGETFAGFLTGGQNAARNLVQIDRLEGLLAETPGGLAGGANLIAGNMGIDLGSASGVQAAQALINTLVPQQRPPGSGPMSDADLELFKQSLPRIINQPGGNQLIIDTIRQINAYDMELARITQEGLAAAEMTDDPKQRAEIRRQMRAQINALQNPIDAIRDLDKSGTGVPPGLEGVTIRKISD